MPTPTLVVAFSSDGYLQPDGSTGSAQNALFFHLCTNPLQEICFDAYRAKGFALVKVAPEQAKSKSEHSLEIAVHGGEPLWGCVAHDTLTVATADEEETNELFSLMTASAIQRAKRDFGLELQTSWFSLKPQGFLTERDKETFLKAQGLTA